MTNFYATYSASSSGGGTSTVLQGTIPWIVASQGRAIAALAHLNYVLSPVSSGAYTTLLAATTGVVNELFVAETSGTCQILAVGALGLEVDTLYMGPGGNTYDVLIAAGARLSLKNNDFFTTTSNTGQITITGMT